MVLLFCTRALECILEADRKAYGGAASYTLDKDNNDFQNGVDNVLAGRPESAWGPRW